VKGANAFRAAVLACSAASWLGCKVERVSMETEMTSGVDSTQVKTTPLQAGPAIESPTAKNPFAGNAHAIAEGKRYYEWFNCLGWFTHVNHRSIGRRFIITAFVFFLLGGLEALLMRMQLARPERAVLDPDLYRQLVTMHGTTMMFFFAVPCRRTTRSSS
jgi:hypothetical protein